MSVVVRCETRGGETRGGETRVRVVLVARGGTTMLDVAEAPLGRTSACGALWTSVNGCIAYNIRSGAAGSMSAILSHWGAMHLVLYGDDADVARGKRAIAQR
jgi:hypothetical protein